MSSTLILSREEHAELRNLCTGLDIEMGSSWRPEHMRCLSPQHTQRRTVTVNVQFPTDAGAEKWNLLHEKRIRYAGHAGTVALAITLGLITEGVGAGWVLGAGLGAGSGIAKDELQTYIWYPKMHRGWTLVRRTAFTYEQGLHQSWLSFNMQDTLKTHLGQVHEQKNHGTYRLQVIPDGGEQMLGHSGIEEKNARAMIGGGDKTVTKVFE